jgi:hypothetical protein
MRVLLKWNAMWAGLKWLRAGCCGHGSKHLGCVMAGDFLTRWTTVCCPVAWNVLQSGESLLCTYCTGCDQSFMLPTILPAHWRISSFWFYFQGSIFSWSQGTCFDIFTHFTLHYCLASYIQNLSFSQWVMTPCSMVVGHHLNCGNKVVFLKYLCHL